MARFVTILLQQVCSRRYSLIFGIGLFAVLLLFMFLSFVVAEPGTGTYLIAVVNIVTLSFLITVAGGLLWICYRRPALVDG